MSDHYNYLTVALQKDLRDDDAEWIINAIKMIKGVLNVKPNVVSPGDWSIGSRIKNDLRNRLYDVLKDD